MRVLMSINHFVIVATSWVAYLFLFTSVFATMARSEEARADDAPKVRIGIVTFLSGPAAEALANTRYASELLVDAINEGSLPPPFDRPGLAGAPIEPIFVDETGGATRMVTEFRNLVQRREVDVVLGYISSADCNAIAPIAEELATLTIYAICAVPIFEERAYQNIFQTTNHATAHSVGLARFVARHYPDLKTVAGINPNYAWGHDTWGTFSASLKVLNPDVEIVAAQWPKLFAGQYNAEISVLLAAKPDLIHTALWASDLVTFTIQASPRGLFARSQIAFAVGLHVLPQLDRLLPDGTIITTHGRYGRFMPKSAISDWFKDAYAERYGDRSEGPNYPGTAFVEAFLGLKSAYDKAADAVGRFPTREEVISAFQYLEWSGPSGLVRMANGDGHQAILGSPVGLSRADPATGKIEVINVEFFGAECINPPPDWKSLEWIEAGFPGAKCD